MKRELKTKILKTRFIIKLHFHWNQRRFDYTHDHPSQVRRFSDCIAQLESLHVLKTSRLKSIGLSESADHVRF